MNAKLTKENNDIEQTHLNKKERFHCRYAGIKGLYPNIFKLVELLLIFPLSAAVVERLFSRMKLVKTRLQNHILDENLDILLMIRVKS